MKKSWLYIHHSFSELKQRIYQVVLPVLFITYIVLFIFGYRRHFFTICDYVIFTILFLGISFCYFLLILNKNRLHIIEVAVCVTASIVFIIGMFDSIVNNLGFNGNHLLGSVVYWTPLLIIFYFLTFKGIIALIFSLIIYSFTVLLGIYHVFLSTFSTPLTVYTLFQYYFASLAIIIAIYYFHSIIEIYLEAEISYERAHTDYLTNLPNRRRLEQKLNEEVEKARSNETTLSVILFDIDYFKIINDTFGHDVGDLALKNLSQIVRENIRDTDYFGRWGGEEFLIIAIHKNLLDGIAMAERMRDIISKKEFEKFGIITCSFGVAELQKNEICSSLIKRADIALYKAKKSGRNQVGTI